MDMYSLEKKFGKYAIKNLTLVIIFTYVLGFILQSTAGPVMALLRLEPYRILHGQVWRLFSWLLIPPYSFDIFTIINLFFFFTIGKLLEKMWGDFRYNVYIFTGILFVIIGVFLMYFIFTSLGIATAAEYGADGCSQIMGYFVSTYYIDISVMLAFAMTIPDMQVRFWFIIPLKMKWLAYIEGFFLLISFWNMGILEGRLIMIFSLLNFFMFLIQEKMSKSKYGKRRNSFQRAFSTPDDKRRNFTVYTKASNAYKNVGQITRHKCAICGQSELDAPNLTFRYCSKCNGNYEYCENHLYTHTHIE